MDTQSAVKLPFNLKIVPMNRNGIPVGLPFLAMLNPENIAIREELQWRNTSAPGSEGTNPVYIKTKPRTFTFELTLDGTGVNTNGAKIPVTAQVLLFRSATTHVVGLIHRPPYLLVQYGLFVINCILNSSSVTYTMFDMFGLPIRAKITASFTERIVKGLSDVLNMLSSPDLTHRVTVKDGDLLPLLTYNIYNDQNYYLQVAKVNKLKNFRNITAGTTLIFPPLAKE